MEDTARFLNVWKKEAAATRKVISRIPEGSDYRPDPKSRTAREIAWVLVYEETGSRRPWLTASSTGKTCRRRRRSRSDTYDRGYDSLTGNLERLTAPQWERQVSLLYGGQEIMKQPAPEMAWGFLLDIIHHRGQLSTYLRPMGSTVPQIYGPTADEPM
jgi:uncharacterized damage-inducible protein DinB